MVDIETLKHYYFAFPGHMNHVSGRGESCEYGCDEKDLSEHDGVEWSSSRK